MASRLVKYYLISSFLLTSFFNVSTVYAKTVTAEGQGRNRHHALKDAWRNAVEIAVGGYISSTTLVKNHQLIEDKILAYSDGYIESFDVLNERYRGRNYWVKIKATVKKGLLVNTLKRHNIDIKGESLYATLMSNQQSKKNRVEVCKKELGAWHYPEDYATVTCDIEVHPSIEENLKEGKYYRSAYISASNIYVDVNEQRINVLKKWISEAVKTDNRILLSAIEDISGYHARDGYDLGLHLYDTKGKLIYKAKRIDYYKPHSWTVAKEDYYLESWRFRLIKDTKVKHRISYQIKLDVLKNSTEIQPILMLSVFGQR